MAKVVVGAKLQVDSGEATKSVKGFRDELKEAQQDLKKVQAEYGQFSEQAAEAAERVMELRNKIEDITEASSSFDMDRKAEALGRSIIGVTGGFSALQGVLALVGTGSEEVEKQLLKVQAAMAISQGIADIMDSAKGFKELGMMIRNSTVFMKANDLATKAASVTMKLFGVSVETTATSFKILKGAIAATGIGLAVVAIGFLVEKLMSMASASDDAAEKQRELADSMKKAESAALSSGMTFLEQDKQLALARAKSKGASEAELFAIEQKYSGLRLEQMQKFIGKTEDNNKLLDDIEAERTQAEIDRLNFQTAQAQKAAEERKRIADKQAEEAKRRAEEAKRQREAEIEAARKLNEELHKLNAVNGAGGGEASDLVKLSQEFEEKKAVLVKGNQSLLELEAWYYGEKLRIEREYREKQKEQQKEEDEKRAEEAAAIDEKIQKDIFKKIDLQLEADELERQSAEKLAEAKKQYYSDIGNAAGALSEIIGQQTAVGKGLAVAQATMNTWQGATEVLRAKSILPEPAATISKAVNFAAVVASGFKAIKGILSVKTAGGGGSVSAPNMSTAAPLTPQLQTTSTQLNQSSISAMGNQAVRAYMVESDVTDSQEKITRLNRAARL